MLPPTITSSSGVVFRLGQYDIRHEIGYVEVRCDYFCIGGTPDNEIKICIDMNSKDAFVDAAVQKIINRLETFTGGKI